MSADGFVESLRDKSVPSKTTNVHWICVSNCTDRNSQLPAGDTCGKWLIFRKLKDIDETWEKVRVACQNGDLGIGAKVRAATEEEAKAEPGSKLFDEVTKVICVYTRDWTDKEDVDRVREVLRNLGITEKIPYKTDADTNAGIYRHTGHTKISKYYA